MKFIVGSELSKEMKNLARAPKVKAAIAYWGANAPELLELRADHPNVQIICCLKGGKSDPDVIEPYGKRARQNDKLHAKVRHVSGPLCDRDVVRYGR